MKRLCKDRNIVISKSDKGNGVVLMKRTDYIEKMNGVLLVSSNFKEIPKYEDIYKININIEDRINYQMRKLKKKMNNAINEN